MLDSELTPQVAIVSPLADRPQIEPLVHGLRARGIDVWWDGDGLRPGDPWEQTTWAILQRAPITCVLLSEASLASPHFRRAIDVSLIAKKHLVPIRVGHFDRARPLPGEITQR
jgi:hypothetical protein